MSDLLDNANVLAQKDPEGALKIAAEQFEQALLDVVVWNKEHDEREITGVIVTGMGGSPLAALLAKQWLKDDIKIPFEIIRGYELPAWANRNTLVIATSYSGNTEETISVLEQAEHREAQLGIIAAGGKLIDIASGYKIAHVALPSGIQPRMTVIYNLRALVALFETFGIVQGKQEEIAKLSGWLGSESARWRSDVPFAENYAKQLADKAVGKIPVIYGGALTAPLAYKWKISWNESSKNVAFWNEYPEFNHNEFIGWTSHPIEKPFVIFDLISSFEHPQILKRFAISDKLLSGKRPKAITIELAGDTLLAQLLWGAILADFVSIYVGILNGVDPTPVALVEKLKHELA